jgi:pimeloyl-ACP methyl ester carboxylesterase
MVTIPGASHLVHIDRPAEFVAAIQSATSAGADG